MRDVRPIFQIARIFGLVPYSFTETGVSISRWALMCSFLWLAFYSYVLYVGLHYSLFSGDEIKGRVLWALRTSLIFVSRVLYVVVFITRVNLLQNALGYLKEYDEAVKVTIDDFFFMHIVVFIHMRVVGARQTPGKSKTKKH